MEKTELRIGNYLYYEATTHVVSGILGNRVYSWWVKNGKAVIEYETKDVGGAQVKNPYIDNAIRYEPIPLTEEWLLKFGCYTSNWDDNTSFRLSVNEHYVLTINLEFETYEIGDLDILPIKYVHQLQNLYFALTGEELTIKQD